ncbi:MAG: hypothetical protein IJX66_09795 [Lachnospiraceae bacterium]|nr:hypothetical protein [Lachnospiraceae bacterium]
MDDGKMSTIEELCEQFLQMEEDKNLFEVLNINSVNIWHYIRSEIYVLLLKVVGQYENINLSNIEYEDTKKLSDWIDEKIVRSQFRISHREMLVFNYTRRVKQGKYYNCIYTDEWLKNFTGSYYVFEGKYAGKIHFKPVKTKHLRYYEVSDYVKLFNKKYSPRKNQKEVRGVTKYIMDMLEAEFGVKISAKDKVCIKNIIKNFWLRREIGRDYYTYLLKRINPKVIVMVISHSFDHMMVCEIAKEMGIPTIELQQGHMGKGLIPYNFKGKVKLTAFPDYLFVNGQHELDLARLPIPKENVYIVGSTELEKQVNYYKQALSNKKKRKKIITFISGTEPEMIDAAIELSKKIDSNKYKIYVKLHPTEYTNWQTTYPELAASNIEVADDSKHNIYYYMAVSDWLIGIASTVLFEATRFECNIMILRRLHYFESASLVETGNAVYIDSMDDAVTYINRNISPHKPSDYFYCGDSCQRIYEAIEDVLHRTE